MRLASIKQNGAELAALVTNNGLAPIAELNRQFNLSWPETILEIIKSGSLNGLNEWQKNFSDAESARIQNILIKHNSISYAPLYRNPGKIWGIGLNYTNHATDLSEQVPQGMPASFVKTNTTIIGCQDSIKLPKLSKKVTGEAELGIIIGKEAKGIPAENWLGAVAGFTTIIDMTAEDILRRNPRYLTVSKNFDTFFSFGPQLITPDEIPNLDQLKVSTIKNNNVVASNVISQMAFNPAFLISFHSQVMTLEPGDIISSGTPGAVELNDGDTIECRIDGFEPLINSVTDLKRS